MKEKREDERRRENEKEKGEEGEEGRREREKKVRGYFPLVSFPRSYSCFDI